MGLYYPVISGFHFLRPVKRELELQRAWRPKRSKTAVKFWSNSRSPNWQSKISKTSCTKRALKRPWVSTCREQCWQFRPCSDLQTTALSTSRRCLGQPRGTSFPGSHHLTFQQRHKLTRSSLLHWLAPKPSSEPTRTTQSLNLRSTCAQRRLSWLIWKRPWVRTTTFDEENEVDPELLQEAMKCKPCRARASPGWDLTRQNGRPQTREHWRVDLISGGWIHKRVRFSADLKQAGRLFLVEACRRRNGHRQSARKRVETTNCFFFELSPRKNWGRSCRNNPCWRSIGFRWVAKPKPLQ